MDNNTPETIKASKNAGGESLNLNMTEGEINAAITRQERIGNAEENMKTGTLQDAQTAERLAEEAQKIPDVPRKIESTLPVNQYIDEEPSFWGGLGFDKLSALYDKFIQKGKAQIAKGYAWLKSSVSSYTSDATTQLSDRLEGKEESKTEMANDITAFEQSLVSIEADKAIMLKEDFRDPEAKKNVEKIKELLKDKEQMKNVNSLALNFVETIKIDFDSFLNQNKTINEFISGYDITASEEKQMNKWKSIDSDISKSIMKFTSSTEFQSKLTELNLPSYLKSYIQQRLGKKAVDSIIDKIAKKNKPQSEAIQAVYRKARIENPVIKKENVALVSKQTGDQLGAEEKYIEIADVLKFREEDLRTYADKFKLTSEETNIDPDDSASLLILRQRHPDINDKDYVSFVKQLKLIKQTKIQLEDTDQIQKIVLSKNKLKLEGKSDEDIAKIEDQMNNEKYGTSYRSIEKQEEAYQLLSKNENLTYTQTEMNLVIEVVNGPEESTSFTQITEDFSKNGANVSNLKYENGKINGELTTEWGITKDFSCNPKTKELVINDSNSDTGVRKIGNKPDKIQETVVLINADEALLEASKQRSTQEISDTKIKDKDLLAIVKEIKFNRFNNKSEKINFFSNLLAITRHKNEDQNKTEHKGVENKMIALRHIFLDPQKNKIIMNILKNDKKFQFDNFSKFLEENSLA